MLGLRNEILSTTSFGPRAHLEGVNIPPGLKLPPLDLVRLEAEQLPECQRDGIGSIRAVFYSQKRGIVTGDNDDRPLPEPLAWNTSFPNLFKFSYFAHTQDVPVELLEPVIFTLKMFIRVLEESTEDQLRAIGHYLPNQDAKKANYVMLANSRFKLCQHLMKSVIDRPAEAMPYFEAAVQADQLNMGKATKAPWLANPLLWTQYCEARTLAGVFTDETKVALEHALMAMDSPKVKATSLTNLLATTVQIRIHLANVLLRLGANSETQKEHTEWAANWLRKNPKLIQRETLRQILAREDQPPHPVLTALGGLDWLEPHETTYRMDERQSKQCRTCSAREPQVKLSRCAGCQRIWYCSKECQRSNWKFHKEFCKESARSKAKTEELTKSDPSAGQKASDWIKWRDGSHFANTHALAFALGLYRDPSRGRTHIVFRQVEYTPKGSKDIRHKFRVARCGVFRIADVLSDIELMMGLDKGEGKDYVQSLLDELNSTNQGADLVPILDLTFGDAIETWMGSMALPLSALRQLPYNARWRKTVNQGEPPEPIMLRSGAQDVEHVF